MDVKLLVIHRKERYTGEHGYEVLAAVDEYSDSDNPEWFEGECARQLAACEDDVAAHAVITVRISGASVRALLYPEIGPIHGIVKKD